MNVKCTKATNAERGKKKTVGSQNNVASYTLSIIILSKEANYIIIIIITVTFYISLLDKGLQ